jgi:methionine aminotransferase
LQEITITCGATEALFDAIQTVVGPGDEAVIFDPAYDSYEPAVRLAGGRCVRIPMQPPAFAYDWDRVRAALTPQTRLIIINSPQNPSCTIARRADLDQLASLIRDRPISVLSDEVYEHVVYDGEAHASVLAHSELRERSFAVYSFGKTLHATGWRTGYCVSTPALTSELRKVHQFNTFSIAAPLQEAIARYLARAPHAWTCLSAYFQARRDLLMRELQGSGFEILRPQGSYFLLLDYGQLDRSDDLHFCDRLIREAKVASIPLSVFYAQPPAMHLVRLCVAKREETLLEAARRLREFAQRIG